VSHKRSEHKDITIEDLIKRIMEDNTLRR